ncbi:uncharacterized protein LOC110667366 [Hevea brasiliensis]|uniref:uncharacterized protein LOC110667366 n=1 Tax=Hevea brasiliensis TaxID=3981 RepID=UPI0025D821A7|nr:uncharacterized protein LOC110667366 [Hevea brasiliensis]
MEPEIIDWNSIDSVFVEDETYENLDAPKWVDFSAFGPDEQLNDDDDAWFYNPNCKHPKIAEDFKKSTLNSKVKCLRSVTISEMLPFRDRACRYKNKKNHFSNFTFNPTFGFTCSFSFSRDAKIKESEKPNLHTPKAKENKSAQNLGEDMENKNPNLYAFPPVVSKNAMTKSGAEKKRQMGDSHGNSSKPKLRSTFSARNLRGGRAILSQITEFCSELKKFVKKGSKKGSREKVSNGVLGDMEERVGEKERVPLLEVKK